MKKTIVVGVIVVVVAVIVWVMYNTGPRHKPPTDPTATATPSQSG